MIRTDIERRYKVNEINETPVKADEACNCSRKGCGCGNAKVMQGLTKGKGLPPCATINIDSKENFPERHGAMWDLAASEDVEFKKGETKIIPLGIRMKLPDGYFGLIVPRSSACLKHGIMMANSVGIIEPDYAGDSDVWGFVAYAVRGTKIAKGTRIAQFMPVPMFGDLDFKMVDSMPYKDRGGYGSTGDMSNGVEPGFCDRHGRKQTVGCYCRIRGTDSIGIVKKLYENKERGPIVLADFSGYGELRKRCTEVELDDRHRDCNGVPINVGDHVYPLSKKFRPGRAIAEDALIDRFVYCMERHLIDKDWREDDLFVNMRNDLLRRMKVVANRD